MTKKRENAFSHGFAAAAMLAIGLGIAWQLGWQPSQILPVGMAGIIGAILGVTASSFNTLLGPLWFRYVNAPHLHVVIDGITKTLSKDAEDTLINEPEFDVLMAPLRWTDPGYYLQEEDDNPAATINVWEGRLRKAKLAQSTLKDEIESFNKDLKMLERLGSGDNDLEEIILLNRRLPGSLRADIQEAEDDISADTSPKTEADKDSNETTPATHAYSKQSKPKNTSGIKKLVGIRYRRYIKWMDETRKLLDDKLPSAERKLIESKGYFEDQRSIFTVFATLINRGGFAVATRAPALLRVTIAPDSVIDIKLTSEKKTNIVNPNQATAIVFNSGEIRSMEDEQQKRIGSFWGIAVNARLLIEDVRLEICKSNIVAFAEGSCQQTIYDRLARNASLDA